MRVEVFVDHWIMRHSEQKNRNSWWESNPGRTVHKSFGLQSCTVEDTEETEKNLTLIANLSSGGYSWNRDDIGNQQKLNRTGCSYYTNLILVPSLCRSGACCGTVRGCGMQTICFILSSCCSDTSTTMFTDRPSWAIFSMPVQFEHWRHSCNIHFKLFPPITASKWCNTLWGLPATFL